jgi:hypothetical protein|tara:strand:+ start:582 stop:1205 length:624 start_codon:yes stop_codon:yes gene_type:complete
MAGNNHIINSTGRGVNAFSNTFHGLRRTQDGKLYYTLRDTNVGTFSNDGDTTELSSDADFLEVEESFISGQDETFTGNGSLAARTLAVSPQFGDRIAVFVDRKRLKETTDYTLSGTTLTFTRAPHDNAEIFVRKIDKTYKNDNNNTYQQYKFERGRNHYKLNSDGKFLKTENRKMPIDEANFPDDVLDSEFAAYDGNAIVNSTTYKA